MSSASPKAAPAGGDAIGFKKPTTPFAPKRLIADLLRTRQCAPGSIFLVERVDRSIVVSSRCRAVRLLLGDGELCVQALLAGDVHRLVDDGVVYEGCYVRVDRFELRYLSVDGGQMALLLVRALDAVGWNETFLQMVEAQGRAGAEEEKEEQQSEDGTAPSREASRQAPAVQKKEHEHQDRREQEETRADTEMDDAFEVISVSPQRSMQRPEQAAATAAAAGSLQPGRSAVQASLPWTSSDPTKPLKLTPLRAIPYLPFKQNWIVNVLAVVASLSDLEPSHLAPFEQRTARLADPSTRKQVHLTVFLDPDDFVPNVGSVVLLVGLKNHRFDGGSLKKYASDRPCSGAGW